MIKMLITVLLTDINVSFGLILLYHVLRSQAEDLQALSVQGFADMSFTLHLPSVLIFFNPI